MGSSEMLMVHRRAILLTMMMTTAQSLAWLGQAKVAVLRYDVDIYDFDNGNKLRELRCVLG
jgi:hypothetical protein